jgi:undecaprenyl phosphate-alpha-L-ara4FN deformylase
VRGTWFVTLGPDNMGRHAWRLLRPAFAMKMMRSGAASLYGWDILLRGTFWPGQEIGWHLVDTLRLPERGGHEVGLHAWDHHRWQVGAECLPDETLNLQLERAIEAFVRVYGRAPSFAAAPGWRFDERLLTLPASRGFTWRSDARGAAEPFLPMLGQVPLPQPQVPVDLPTYDEGVGRGPGADERWNASLLERLADGEPHVLTVHAESEGGAKAALFERFLDAALAAGHRFEPLGEWMRRFGSPQAARIARGSVPGREGWLCVRG